MDKFGLDLLRLSVGGDTESGVLGSRANAVIVLIHWRLLKEGFRCAGTGDTFSADKDISPPTEALPPGWNCMDDGLHCLRYRHKTTNEKFVLKSFVTATESDQASSSTSSGGQHQIVVLLRVGDDRTSELDIDLNEEVSESEERFKPIREDQMLAMIEDKLLKPLMKVKKSEEGDEKKRKSDESEQRDRDPLRGPGRPGRPGPPPRGPPRLPDMPGPGNPDPDDDPFGPFAPGGGNPNGPLWDPVPGLPNMGPRGGFPGRSRGGFPGGPRGGFPPPGGFGPGGFGGGGLGGFL